MITKRNAEALFEADVASGIIESTVKASKAMQLFQRLQNGTSNMMKLRVMDSLPVGYWVGQTNNGRKSLSKMSWENKFIVYEELAVIIPIKEDDLNDAAFDIWGYVKPRVAEAFAKKFDQAVLVGVDKPLNFRADLLTSVVQAGAKVTATSSLYNDISDAMGYVEESGFEPTGLIGGLDLKAKFRKMVDGNNLPITGTEVNELAKSFVDNGAWDKTIATAIVGDFSQAVYSIRQDVSYKLLDQAIIQDPSTGTQLYNLAQEDMVALRATMRIGWEIPNPVNAAGGEDAFPFSVIVPSAGVPTTQTVTFTVTDGTDEVVGAKVTFGGMKGKTNASGVVTFNAQAGDYKYTVDAEGFAKQNGSVTVASSAVSKTITLNF